MPNWRSGIIGVVEAGEAAAAVPHIMKVCGVDTLDLNALPRYKRSCLVGLLAGYEVRGSLYVADVYGITSKAALRMGIDRDVLLERAWSFLSGYICGGIGDAECDEETWRLSCCKSPCGHLCELARYIASSGYGIKIYLNKPLEEFLGISQNL